MNEKLLYTPYFDRFDICEAYYCYAIQYHNGQWSEEYEMLGRLKNMDFNTSMSIENELEQALTDNGKEIYCNILKKRENINWTIEIINSYNPDNEEWCSNCDTIVYLNGLFERQKCPYCKIEMLPCNKCYEIYENPDCCNCPLGE